MFKDFLNFFNKPALVEKAEDEVHEMLNIAYEMFHYSMGVVIENKKEREDIYKIDQRLNKLQIKVRKNVLEHLAINPAQDIIPSLILSTVVVDIERIGDYSKNLVELSHKYNKPLEGSYIKKIREMESKVQCNFKQIMEVFKKKYGEPGTGEERGKETGEKIMQSLTNISKECQSILEEVVEEDDLATKEGIIYALLLRYLKRVSAHLKNVASSVVNPFYKVGYKPENVKDKKR